MRSRRALRLIVMSVGGALLFLVWMLLWYCPTSGPVPLDVPDAGRVPAASDRTTESASSGSDTSNPPVPVQPQDSIMPPDDTPRVPYRETVVLVMNDEGALVAGR